MSDPFIHRRRIAFSETDMAGLVHFSNFFKYMEEAETAFYRSLGLEFVKRTGDRYYGWPRIHARCDYRRPLRFDDEVHIHLRIAAVEPRKIQYSFEFMKEEKGSVRLVAAGETITMCVLLDPLTGKMESTDIPENVCERLRSRSA